MFKPKLQRLGVGIHITSDDGKSGCRVVEITHLPACMVEREAHELRRGRQSVAITMVEVSHDTRSMEYMIMVMEVLCLRNWYA